MKSALVPVLVLALLIISFNLVASTSPNPPATISDASPSSTALASAINYLVSNYNRTIGLIPEIPRGNTYWTYSDNLLASTVLSSHPENKTLTNIAANITSTMNRYNSNLAHGLNQYMVFTSGIGAFNSSNNYNLAKGNGATIDITLNNGTSTLDPSIYGDIALLKAIYYQHRGEYHNATKYFQLAYNMYDGKGIKDIVFTSGSEAGIYQTYKLALFILAAKIMQQTIPNNTTSILLSQQATSGGFYTGYRYQDGTLYSAGSTNTETTSLAILALSYPPSPASAAINSDAKIPVGAVLYVWYGFNSETSTWTGHPSTSHWNDSDQRIVIDTPYQGYYSSYYEIANQLRLMSQAGLTYVVISWWGWGVTNFSDPQRTNPLNAAINQAALQAFRAVQNMGGSFKIALLVDAFTNPGNLNSTNYDQIYNYVWNNFYKPYLNYTLTWQGKPLLLWFNPMNATDNASFTSRIVGNNLSYNMSDRPLWIWTRAPDDYLLSWAGWNTTDGKPDPVYRGEPSISKDGFVSTMPRYDDFYLYPAGRGCHCYMQFDPAYSLGLYEHEWNDIIQQSKQNHNVGIVLINSWNEYHERTAVEPHNDFSAPAQPQLLLYNQTQQFVSQLEAPASSPPPPPPPSIWPYILVGAIIGAAALATGLTFRSRKLINAKERPRRKRKRSTENILPRPA